MRIPAPLALAPLLLAACQTPIPPPEHTLNRSVYESIAADRTVYIAPPEIASIRYREHADVLRLIAEETRLYLEAQGFTVLAEARFNAAWENAAASLGGLYDPASGDKDQVRLDQCFALTMDELATETPFTGVLIPRVDYENCNLESPYKKAEWEGVRRRIQTDGGVSSSRWMTILTMTLRPRLVTSAGALAYEGAGGLDFAHKAVVDGSEFRQVLKETDDFDRSDLREGVRLALQPLAEE